MNYSGLKLRSALAAEYALGTLTGRARRRFDRIMNSDAGLLREVALWEQRLLLLEPRLPPIQPRQKVWTRIAQGIDALPGLAVVDAPRVAANDNRFWRTWAGIASAAAVILAAALLARTPLQLHAPTTQVAAQSYVALLQMPNSTMQWTLSIVPEHGHISVAANGEPPPLDGKSLELWWLSANGPVAIGVLPTQGTQALLLPQGLGNAGGAVKLAISVEPAGGSPTGKPTGPVVIVADAVKAA